MSLYIVLGILVSLILMAYIWLGNRQTDDTIKILLTVALATTGWAAWPAYLILGFAMILRKLAPQKQGAE